MSFDRPPRWIAEYGILTQTLPQAGEGASPAASALYSGERVVCGIADDGRYPAFFLTGRFHPASDTCRPRATVS